MPLFKVINKKTGEMVHYYNNDKMADVCGLDIPAEDIQQIECTEEMQAEMANKNHYDVIKADVNKLLDETDWTQLSDTYLSAEKVLEFKLYRQSIREAKDLAKINASGIVLPPKPIT